MYVYEVRDVRDEIYYPLGIFLKLDEAKQQMLSFGEDETMSGRDDDDYEIIAVYQRLIGWDDNIGSEVFRIRREKIYREEYGDYIWEITERHEKIEIVHQPKGSMCMVCTHAGRDCSKLAFNQMLVLEKHIGLHVVRCSFFDKQKDKKC